MNPIVAAILKQIGTKLLMALLEEVMNNLRDRDDNTCRQDHVDSLKVITDDIRVRPRRIRGKFKK